MGKFGGHFGFLRSLERRVRFHTGHGRGNEGGFPTWEQSERLTAGSVNGGDQSDQLTAASHVLSVHRHIQYLPLHAHGGQPVDQLQETQRVASQPVQRVSMAPRSWATAAVESCTTDMMNDGSKSGRVIIC